MKPELTKQFVKKTIRKIVIFTIIMFVALSVFRSMSPIVSNTMALTQMQHSNEMFVMMETYNKIKPIFNAVSTMVYVWFACTIVRDIYKFVKVVNNEKEN